MKLLLPLLLIVFGVGVGGGVGYFLKPAPEPVETAEEGEGKPAALKKEKAREDAYAEVAAGMAENDSEYHALGRKLVVPFTRGDGSKAFVALDLSLETAPAGAAVAELHEPKLIDAFLRTIVSFTSTGAFDDHGKAPELLRDLNVELLKAARGVLGEEPVRQVLIVNLITQDA